MNKLLFTEPNNEEAEVSNGAMTTTRKKGFMVGPEVTITLRRSTLDQIIAGELSPQDAIESGLVTIQGDRNVLSQFFGMLDEGDPEFPIVTPRPNARLAWIGRAPQEAVLKRRFRIVGKVPRGC